MAISGNNLYVVGSFTSVQGGVTRNYAASFNRFTGALNPWNPELNGIGTAVTVTGGSVYVVGYFTQVGSSPAITRNHAAAFDLTVGSANTWNPNLDAAALAILPYNGQVYLGGGFTTVNGATTRRGAAAVNALTGVVSTAWNADLSVGNSVYGISTRSTGTVVLSGNFNSASGAPRGRLVEVDKTSGLPTSLNPGYGFSGTLDTEQVGSYLYSGGSYADVGNGYYLKNNLAVVNATNGTVYAWNPAPNGYVWTVVPYGSSLLFVGGGFTTIGGYAKQGFAAIMPPNGQVATPNATPTSTPTRTATPTVTFTPTVTP